MTLLYNLFIFILFLVSTISNFKRVKKRGWFFIKSKLGIGLNQLKIEQKKRVWFHAVSLGELKACESLILKHQALKSQVFVSTCSDTGFQLAQSFKGVEVFYLPIDFSFLMRRIVDKIMPDLLVVVESDVWPQMLLQAKKRKVRLHFVNAKISKRSFSRLKKAKPIARWLYGCFDLVDAQNKLYLERFKLLGVSSSKLYIQKNLKFKALNRLVKTQNIVLNKREGVIMFSCTHEGEERLLLEGIRDLMGLYTLIIAPRHPERCDALYEDLQKWGVQKSSQTSHFTENCILIDQMGVLDSYYCHADVIVMGASFIDGLGGHNILEPLIHKKKLFFGPYMENQMDFVNYVIEDENCQQIELDQLYEKIVKVFAQKCCC